MRFLQAILVAALTLVLSGSAQVLACSIDLCMTPPTATKSHGCCGKNDDSKSDAPSSGCGHCLDSQNADRNTVVRDIVVTSLLLDELATPSAFVSTVDSSFHRTIDPDHAPPPILLNLVQQSCQLNF